MKKWVTCHGVAININPDLKAFQNIVPCGIKEFGVTSLRDLNIDVNRDFDELVKEKFFEILENFK